MNTNYQPHLKTVARNALVQCSQFVILPIVNPDGFAFTYASSGDRLWRKNRRPPSGGMGLSTMSTNYCPQPVGAAHACRRINHNSLPHMAAHPSSSYRVPHGVEYPVTSDPGVDLNRNFPSPAWARDNPCEETDSGPTPLSEPETRSVRPPPFMRRCCCAMCTVGAVSRSTNISTGLV